jgi:hypothetical protein
MIGTSAACSLAGRVVMSASTATGLSAGNAGISAAGAVAATQSSTQTGTVRSRFGKQELLFIEF